MTRSKKHTFENQPPLESLIKKGAILDFILPNGIRLGDATRKDVLDAVEYYRRQEDVAKGKLAALERDLRPDS